MFLEDRLVLACQIAIPSKLVTFIVQEALRAAQQRFHGVCLHTRQSSCNDAATDSAYNVSHLDYEQIGECLMPLRGTAARTVSQGGM